MFDINRLAARSSLLALICLVMIGSSTFWAGASAQLHERTAAHFTPPEGCIPDPRLAVASRAVQACIERFSPTHEFIIALWEKRYRPNRPGIRPSGETARQAVEEYVATFRHINQSQPGQRLLVFNHMATLRKSFPPSADYCELVSFAQSDRRVPRYEGQEFRMWGQDFVCARADMSRNLIQLLDLRASERFRVATDHVKERFSAAVPMSKAFEAEKSLRFD